MFPGRREAARYHELTLQSGHSVGADHASRNRPNIELISADTLIAEFPKAPVTHDKAFMWTTNVRHNGKAASRSVNPVNAGEILHRLAGAKVHQLSKQEGPRYRGPSCFWRPISEGWSVARPWPFWPGAWTG